MEDINKYIEPWDMPVELELRVMRDTPDEVRGFYESLGKVEFTAHALGLACHYSGLDMVKALVECGAKFSYDYEVSRKLGRKAVCIYAERPDYNYAAFVFEKIGISYLRSYYLRIYKNVPPLPLDERLEILRYLCENSEKVGLDKDELYFFSFFTGEEKMREILKNSGAAVPEAWRDIVLTGSHEGWERDKWFDYCTLAEHLNDTLFIPNMTELSEELGGGKFHFTEWLWEITLKKRVDISGSFGFLADKFDLSKAKKSEMMKFFIDGESVEGLAFAAENGWLKQPKKRDEMIAYANEKGKTECTAWLLDFKNRTADLKAERERAEKRQNALLNAAPESLTAMKALWGWKKREGGGIMVTNYKGRNTEITVPDKIGKDAVTAVGMAFSPAARALTKEIGDLRETITRVTLPETVAEIADDAFRCCVSLESVNIPKAVTKIGKGAFVCCRRLSEEEIPDGVEEIADYTFEHCDTLKSVKLPESVKRIGINAFEDCGALEKINIPADVTEVGSWAFAKCAKLRAFEIPSKLKEIPAYMLYECVELERVVILSGITVISQQAFAGCERLVEIDIPDTVREIEDLAFARCASLETVVIPEGVTEIGWRVFGDCRNLKRVELPRSLKEISNFDPKGGKPITIFEGSPNVTAVVFKDSYAEKYCLKNGIAFVYKEC